MVGLILVLGLLGGAGSAHAELVTQADADGDTPDVKRVTLDNRQHKVVVRMRHADLSDVRAEAFFVDWEGATHYRVYSGYTSDGYGGKYLYFRLYVYKDGEATRKACGDMRGFHDNESEISGVRVPRSCIKKAPDEVRTRGVAWDYDSGEDETIYSDYAKRG